MTACVSLSAPRSLAHAQCPLLLKMNCPGDSSISIINHAYGINWETIDTGLSSPQGSRKSLPVSLGRKTTTDISFQVLETVRLSTRAIYLSWGSISTAKKIQRCTEFESRKDWVRWLTYPLAVKPSEQMTDTCQSLKTCYDSMDTSPYHLSTRWGIQRSRLLPT